MLTGTCQESMRDLYFNPPGSCARWAIVKYAHYNKLELVPQTLSGMFFPGFKDRERAGDRRPTSRRSPDLRQDMFETDGHPRAHSCHQYEAEPISFQRQVIDNVVLGTDRSYRYILRLSLARNCGMRFYARLLSTKQ